MVTDCKKNTSVNKSEFVGFFDGFYKKFWIEWAEKLTLDKFFIQDESNFCPDCIVGVKEFYKKKKLLEIYGNYDIVKQK